ncbi:MAG: NlpC/P60 family protein [Geodermatophilaceae bacterium]
MATSRVLRSPARVLILAAVAATSLSLAPVSGHAEPADRPASQPAAEPTTAADAQEQVAELNHQLEIATEQYNDARILLDEREAEAALATAQLGQVQRDIADLDGQVRQVAQSAYTGDQLAGFTVLMTSASPQEFLDKLNTLDAISAHSNDLVTDLGLAQQHAQDLAATAERALAEADAAAADMAAKKTHIETDLPVVEALLATLTEQERQAAAALAHGPTTAAAPDRADRASRNDTAPPAPSSPIVAPTEAAQIAVDTAYAQLGDPYVWAADGPDSFDCSGLTMYSYAAAGISLPHSSRMQSTMGVYVPRDQLQPGDLVFYYSPVSHVGIYVGNNQLIEAPNSGSVVQIRDLDAWGGYSHAQRVALP